MAQASILHLLRAFAELVDARAALPIVSHRGFPVGPALVRVKKAYRAAFQPFINETLRRQTLLNERALALFQRVFLDLRTLENTSKASKAELESRIEALESMLERLKIDRRSQTGERPAKSKNGHTTYR